MLLKWTETDWKWTETIVVQKWTETVPTWSTSGPLPVHFVRRVHGIARQVRFISSYLVGTMQMHSCANPRDGSRSLLATIVLRAL